MKVLKRISMRGKERDKGSELGGDRDVYPLYNGSMMIDIVYTFQLMYEASHYSFDTN